MVAKGVKAALAVLAGVGAVIVVDQLFENKEVRPDRRLEIVKLFPEDEGAIFRFFEEVKLRVEGDTVGSAFLYMQTKELTTGNVVDLQIMEFNLRDTSKGSSFVAEWENAFIGEGALVEFFVFDENNAALSEMKSITVRGISSTGAP